MFEKADYLVRHFATYIRLTTSAEFWRRHTSLCVFTSKIDLIPHFRLSGWMKFGKKITTSTLVCMRVLVVLVEFIRFHVFSQRIDKQDLTFPDDRQQDAWIDGWMAYAESKVRCIWVLSVCAEHRLAFALPLPRQNHFRLFCQRVSLVNTKCKRFCWTSISRKSFLVASEDRKSCGRRRNSRFLKKLLQQVFLIRN